MGRTRLARIPGLVGWTGASCAATKDCSILSASSCTEAKPGGCRSSFFSAASVPVVWRCRSVNTSLVMSSGSCRPNACRCDASVRSVSRRRLSSASLTSCPTSSSRSSCASTGAGGGGIDPFAAGSPYASGSTSSRRFSSPSSDRRNGRWSSSSEVGRYWNSLSALGSAFRSFGTGGLGSSLAYLRSISSWAPFCASAAAPPACLLGCPGRQRSLPPSGMAQRPWARGGASGVRSARPGA
mmetsp:Transcript_96877/g.270434  ORF Transcript_96877/g.270434 Transcript_96877/m.270434 type:complete len:240 (-) Transcript_96877:8-727(-)